jgi:hypothetical protein
MRLYTGQLLLWSGITLAHFALTAFTLRRWLGWSAWSLDARLFAILLGGIGTLSAALHATALTVGVGLLPVASVLALWHLAAVLATRARRDARAALHLSALEWAGATALGAIVLSWINVASLAADVAGTDAAHYHVPVAANLALGASLFDLPATQHVYPMAGSAVASWFIVATGGPLLIELTMCLPFLLLVAAFNLLFRLTTGLSGLGWGTWFSLLLFSTPLFRQSSLVSADLWFAAAFVAGLTTIIWAWHEPVWPAPHLLLAAIAIGLLVGSKTTGAFAGALLLALLGLDLLRRLRRRSPDRPSARVGLWVAVAALMLATGGIWLVRNWLMFGSPVAPTGLVLMGRTIFDGDPFGPTTYLSVLGDMEKDPQYDLGARTLRYMRLWVGGWAIPSLMVAVLLLVDWIWSRRAGAGDPRRTARLVLVAATVIFGALLGAALVGAPWTSLEWTRGFSLRYALPVVALALFLPLVALFPVRWPWYVSRDAAAVAVLFAAGSVALLVASPAAARSTSLPPWQWAWVPAGAALVVAAWWISRVSSGGRILAWTVILGVLASGHAVIASGRLQGEVDRTTAAEAAERAALSRGQWPASPAREVYLRVLADEAATGRPCTHRRFFSITRFDEPLLLQSATYRNQVFYAGRPPRIARPQAPVSSCDYVITTAALMETIRGGETARQLAGGHALRELGKGGAFVVFARETGAATGEGVR